MNFKLTSINEYTYPLTDEQIAKYPLAKRDNSKLLIYENEQISENIFQNIDQYLPQKSLLVTNNTKVIRARLEFFKSSGARIEVFCLEPHFPIDYIQSFSSTDECEWVCIIGNLRKWKSGILEKIIQVDGLQTKVSIERKENLNDSHIIKFKWDNSELTFSQLIENLGNIPIPPYLNRKAEASDLKTYQTIYSKHKGSVAAPTAGLHFTNEVFNSLKNKQIEHHEITLHVGAGTFKPVKADTIGDHEMHIEHFIITRDTIPPLLKHMGNITSVGTTTTRTLESLYWLGVKLIQTDLTDKFKFHLMQWEPYELVQTISVIEALNKLNDEVLKSEEDHINASTAIIIAPGYHFRVVDRLITNFHQPKSTLLLLISAFVGEKWKLIYEYALRNEFRFLSYGDSCLLYKNKCNG